MKISAIILTYNRPDALNVILDSIICQYELPYEVIIADDGSGAETQELIRSRQANFPVALKHVWQEDSGFRIAAIRNRAIRESDGDFLIFSDGDLLLHPAFFRDFRMNAARQTALIGSRAFLSKKATFDILNGKKANLSMLSPDIGKNRLNALRFPFLSHFTPPPRQAEKLRGGLLGIWKRDIMAVNGWNEAFTGWGREDTELVVRLQNAGMKIRKLKFSAVTWHLWHPTAERSRLSLNDDLLRHTVENRISWCPDGLSRERKS